MKSRTLQHGQVFSWHAALVQLIIAIIGFAVIYGLINRYESDQIASMLVVAVVSAVSFVALIRFITSLRYVEVNFSMPVVEQKPVSTGEQPKDDLMQLSGVGLKIQSLLVAAGYKSYADIAKATPEELQAVLESAKGLYREKEAETWPEEARLALKAKWTELDGLQEVKRRQP